MIKKILLIEDEEQFRSSVKIALKRKGVSVTEEQDGEDGLNTLIASYVSGDPYDLMILDIMMPKVTGIDILEYMLEEKIDIPVIVVTGFMDYDLKFFCSRIKHITVLEKPFDQHSLVTEVMSMLETSPN